MKATVSPTVSHHATIRALALTGFAGFIGFYLPQPILPFLAQEFSVSPVSASLTVSLTILGLGLAAPVIGILSDSYGRKRLLVFSAAALVIMTAACALSANFTVFLLFRFLQGVLLSGLFVVAVAYSSEVLDKASMARAAGLYVASTVVGGLLGRLLAGLSADFLGWRFAFYLASAAYAALAYIWWRQPELENSRERSATLARVTQGLLRYLRHPLLLRGFLIGFCLFFAFQALWNYLPFKLHAAPLHLSNTAVSLLYLSFIAGMVSSSIAAHFRRRWGLRHNIILGFSLALLGQVLTLSSSLLSIILGLGVLCFGNWLVQALALGFVATEAEQERASANALYLLFYYLGGSVGGTLPGLFFPFWGYAAVIVLSLGVLGLGMVLAWQLEG